MLKELHQFIPFMVKIMMILLSCKPQNIFAHFENENFNLADIMTEAPLWWQTTAVALENFKKLEYIMLCFRWICFQGVITLNDILEALVGDASDFYKDDFQLIEREDGSWLVGHYSLHDFWLTLN
jgi:putative hemolysin